ncbi:FAD dependent oxidoreductase [Peniophora sp. CONT]|nr:FAD dependent oxidoreductase [Peniophora sp. CONT]
MGSSLSRVRSVIRLLLDMKADFEAVEARLKRSPGLPSSPPSSATTEPFWMVPPAEVADYQPDNWPVDVDVVIIGSGITGTSVARALLDEHGSRLNILMLEARAACSGATGRNGGHVNPPLFHDYISLRKEFGQEVAAQTVRWRLSHLVALQRAAEAEHAVEHTQVRNVESVDVYYSQEALDKAKEGLNAWRQDMPEEARDVYCVEGEEARITFRLGPGALAVIATPGGAAHPYRLITTILAGLLERHSERFHLATHTPCTAIDAPTATSAYYTLHTPRGSVRATHIVHATNGWTAHLLPGFRTKIAPVRALMSAQRPGTGLAAPAKLQTPRDSPHSSQSTLAPSPTEPGGRAHVFWTGSMGYDYLTQLPTPGHELMFGGGFARAAHISMDEIGQMDDGGLDIGVATHVSGALPMYFGLQNWGQEGSDGDDEMEKSQWMEGRVKAMWTGIIAISVDGRPWVGRVPTKVSERSEPQASLAPQIRTSKEETMRTAPPGEWIAAGYTGEGMTNAWQAGRAVASLLLGKEPDELPLPMRVTERRWREAKLENLLDRM